MNTGRVQWVMSSCKGCFWYLQRFPHSTLKNCNSVTLSAFFAILFPLFMLFFYETINSLWGLLHVQNLSAEAKKKKNCIKFSVVYDIIIKNKPIATARLSWQEVILNQLLFTAIKNKNDHYHSNIYIYVPLMCVHHGYISFQENPNLAFVFLSICNLTTIS